MTLRTFSVKNIGGYIECIAALSREWKTTSGASDSEIWFRGVGNNKHKLLPGAYRSEIDHDGMFNEFFTKSHSLITPRPANEFEWYFAAQHYGLPTRLLDWSDSPLVALYFAVRALKSENTPCVWAINAASLNEVSCGFPSVLVPRESGDLFTSQWTPEIVKSGKCDPVDFSYNDKSYNNGSPLAILPPRSTPRIIAQRGTFTLHGTLDVSIEEHLLNAEEPLRSHVARIDIEDGLLNLQMLEMLGYDEFYIFPEPASLAQSLSKRYKARPQ